MGEAMMGTAQPVFAVLGPLDVRLDGRSLPLGGVRNQLVLAALLLQEGRTVTVNELADTVWDGDPPATARKQIQAAVSQVRRVLGTAKGLVRTHGFGYQLMVGGGQLDVNRFSDMVGDARASAARGDFGDAADGFRAALRLWRGRPLAGLPGKVVEQHASRLEELRLAVLEECAECELRLGRHRQLIPELQVLAGALPLRERVTGLLMTALAGDGRQAEAISVYYEQAAVLREELGVGPGPLLHRVYVEMLQGPDGALANGAARPGEELRVRDPAVRPAQLPAGIRGFAGRAAAIAELDRHAARLTEENRGVIIVALSGTAGVGKTALAVHWAHRLSVQFPDGQLYVNLRGFDPAAQSVEPGEAVRGFLDALGVPPAQIPAGLSAQTALYRSRLAGTRTLVLLDNARDAEQVRPLLPGTPTTRTIVTSRSQLAPLVAIEGAQPVRLDVLSAAEAADLFARRVGADRCAAEPEAARVIVAACAGLPLALCIAAARARLSGFALAAIAAELRDAGRLDALDAGDHTSQVRAVFSWSYTALTAPAAWLFRFLGLHAGPDITPAAAASLTARPVPEARSSLLELTEAGLLTEHLPGRYTYHDLLHAYAADLVMGEDPEPDRQAALARLLDHYAYTAHTAERLLDPQRELPLALPGPMSGARPERLGDQHAAIRWLTAERSVLIAALRQAERQRRDAQAFHLAWALTTFMFRNGFWHELVGVWQVALGAADRLGNLVARAEAHRVLALTGNRLGRDTISDYRRALDLYQQAGDTENEALTYLGLASLRARQGHTEQGLEHSRQALVLYQAAGDRNGQATALNAIGWFQTLLGEHTRAQSACEESLAIVRQIGDRHSEAYTWDSLGYAHHQAGGRKRAVECYEHALALFHDLGDRYEEAQTLSRLGDAHAAGDPGAARTAWTRAVAILDDLRQGDTDDLRARLRGLEAEHGQAH